jgi:hypothetical protein
VPLAHIFHHQPFDGIAIPILLYVVPLITVLCCKMPGECVLNRVA